MFFPCSTICKKHTAEINYRINWFGCWNLGLIVVFQRETKTNQRHRKVTTTKSSYPAYVRVVWDLVDPFLIIFGYTVHMHILYKFVNKNQIWYFGLQGNYFGLQRTKTHISSKRALDHCCAASFSNSLARWSIFQLAPRWKLIQTKLFFSGWWFYINIIKQTISLHRLYFSNRGGGRTKQGETTIFFKCLKT